MSLECEDVEVELSAGGAVSDVARAHLESCESCQATAKVLGLATLPPLSDAERMLLSGLAATTQRAWRDQQASTSTSGGARRFGSLALAAGLGALLASGVVMKLMPVPEPRIETRTELVATPVLPELTGDETEDFNLSDDDVFFEVGWPSPTEGDL